MRNIYIVNATQVVTSESHPEGLYSVMTGYPKTFDTINFDNDEDKTLRMAKAAYLSQLATNYSVDNRAMTTVTLERADGRQIMRESIGAFPVVPEPEPEPEEEVEPIE